MSGTVETARIAADLVRGEDPTARSGLVDSGSNSLEEGFIALAAAAAARTGASMEACIDAGLHTARRTRYLFSPASLEYLRRGGRIGSASALLGQLLQVKPILTVQNGETATVAKVRTEKRALGEMARIFREDVDQRGLVRAAVHYIGDIGPAEAFARDAIDPVVGSTVDVVPVSPVIGLHVGPAVGLVYETEREPASPATSAQHLLETRR
jgi:DegV family protein with EDD domain